MRKLVTITLPSILLALVLAAAATEVWIRATWDEKQGTPGLFFSDPVLAQRLAPSYDGWFAGVPVRINNLGFRDPRDYSTEKTPRTVRILLVGDSVTFGYGSVYEHTYPRLLEQQLRAWRPDVDWQVWNAGVPGYSTSQELAYVRRVGSRFNPDLVIVGFFMNDVQANFDAEEPGTTRRVSSAIKNFAKRRLYSYDLYRKGRYLIGEMLFGSPSSRAYLAAVEDEEAMLRAPNVATLKEQQLTYPHPIDDSQLTACDATRPAPGAELARSNANDQKWLAAVKGFQQLNRSGTQRVAFFVNIAPDECQNQDRFDDGDMRLVNELFVRILSEGRTPTVSSYEEFKKYRPSEMPLANWHSLGNSNWVKASALFNFVRGYLPGELPQLNHDVTR